MLNMFKEYEVLRKAIDTSATNGNSYLTPTVLSEVITNAIQLVPTLRNYIARVDWPTNVYHWNTRLNPTSAVTAADGGLISYSNPAYTQGNATMSYLYDLFAVTGPMKKSSAPLLDIVTDELQQAMLQVSRKEDQMIIQGDTNNSTFPGLIASTTGTQPFTAIGGSGKTVTRLLMDQVESYQNSKGYQVDAWCVSPNVYSLIKNSAWNNVHFNNVTVNQEVIIGYSQSPTSTMEFAGHPVFQDPYMYYNGQDNVLALSLDRSNLVTAVLENPNVHMFNDVEPQYDRDSYRVQEYFVTILRNPLSAVLLSNVTLPAPTAF